MAIENTTPEADTPEPSLRDALDAAFEQHATDEVDEARAPGAPAPAPAGDESEEQRQRDERGRFAPKAAATAPGAPAAAPPPQAGTQAPPTPSPAPAPDLKAPASWRPEIREKWASVDPEVRAEVHRRESEAQRTLQQGAQARQFIEAFENVVRPYEMFIRAENSNPLQAVQNLMSTAAELRVGTPVSKAQLVAGLCRQYAIDMGLLDSALANNGFVAPGEAPPAQQQPMQDPRFTQYLQMQQQQAAEAQQAEAQYMRNELAAFAQAHEFYGDVKDTMADLIEMHGRRGEVLPIEKAYDMACKLMPNVSTILSQRAATPAAPSPAVLRARRAAVSVRGASTPDGATMPKNDSVRGAIEAAFDAHSS